MIITCPSCSKRYLVDDQAIDSKGRSVQCVSCDHKWFFKPNEASKELEQVHLDLMGATTENDPKKRVSLSWLLSLMVVVSLILGVILAKSHIMSLWPITTKAYKAIGLGPETSLEGLVFESLTPLMEKTADGQTKLMLSGTVANTGTTVQNMTALTVVIKGDCGKATFWERLVTKTIKRKGGNQCRLESWKYIPTESKIYPGEKVSFETKAPKEIDGAKSIQIQF